MKKVLLILALLVVLALLAVFVGARILGPKLISVVAPSGTPIGEYDLPKAGDLAAGARHRDPGEPAR
jgi:hypothetical protein